MDAEVRQRRWTTVPADTSSIVGNPIELEDVGIEFSINRRRKRQIRDMFIRGRAVREVERFWALKGVSLTVRKGESIGIVGSNGSGKSTLLKVIAGVLIPDEGVVQVNGAIAPLIELGAGFSPELSAHDNVYLNGTILGLTEKEIDERFEMIVRFSGVRRFMDTPLKHFSSGMKVRLGFAIVTQLSHPILLIDEVLAVGDRRFRRKCYRAMEEMLDAGRTMVLVSHRERDIERFCTRAIYMQEGEKVMDGPTAEVLERYALDTAED
jgi:ABC-2 type transport system ATP-binding protein